MDTLYTCKACSAKVLDYRYYPDLELCATCAYRKFIVKPCIYCAGTGKIKFEVYHDLQTSSNKKYSATCQKCFGLGKTL